MSKSNLGTRLRAIVDETTATKKLINDLTDNAYELVVTQLELAAKKGETCKTVEISFTGCRGGFERYFELVKAGVYQRLSDEDVFVLDAIDGRSLNISWA